MRQAPPAPQLRSLATSTGGASERVRPLGLGFLDAGLERAFWADVAEERGGHIQRSIALLLFLSVAFAALDFTVYADQAMRLLPFRVAMIVGLSLPAPLVFGRRATAHLARWAQPILLYQSIFGVVCLFLMARAVYGGLSADQRFVGLISILFALLCIYCLSGLRFLYAAGAGLFASASFTFLGILGAPDKDEALVAGAFLFGENFVGLAVAWSLERSARRDFLLRRAVVAARDRTDALLLNLMPASFAERLKADRDGDVLDRKDRASVVFGTITGFADATRELPALEAVHLLDRIVSRLDAVCEAHGVERIKTVGATIMAGAGLTTSREDDAEAAVRCALAMCAAVREVADKEGLPISFRAGVATGPVIVGVIGKTRLAFDCWGDTANLASRLDTHGEPGRVHVGASTAARLPTGLATTSRGRISIKGKGDLETLWVTD